MSVTESRRRELFQDLYPGGVPKLWCPILTHYDREGAIDFQRMSLHMDHLIPWVGGFLIAGSTGDGWDLTDGEVVSLVEFYAGTARNTPTRLLAGVLRKSVEDVRILIDRTLTALKELSGKDGPFAAMVASNVSGITVCPPAGRDQSQAQILAGLSLVLGTGLPMALYQLPQVTENEIAPETFERLVGAFSNLMLFKDTSGNDRVALADIDRGGVFLVRGAEGGYASWLKDCGGPYNGLLLSSANSFPAHLAGIVNAVQEGDARMASDLSDRVSAAMSTIMEVVRTVPYGNAFTNANKAIDHFMAFGEEAENQPAPMLHARVPLPDYVIEATREILNRLGLAPHKGYLQE
jgi:4-hydroxy-tetrahydrodipicolinate synthase